jgi:hypothetical protein
MQSLKIGQLVRLPSKTACKRGHLGHGHLLYAGRHAIVTAIHDVRVSVGYIDGEHRLSASAYPADTVRPATKTMLRLQSETLRKRVVVCPGCSFMSVTGTPGRIPATVFDSASGKGERELVECPDCLGSGKIIMEDCLDCHGCGWIRHEHGVTKCDCNGGGFHMTPWFDPGI